MFTICLPVRYFVLSLTATASFLMYLLRYNLSIAIISMVRLDTTNSSNSSTTGSTHPQNGEFDWEPKVQGYVLAAYFIGYAITQIVGGLLAERWSSKWTQGLGIFVSSICTFATPSAAYMSVWALCAVRLVIGACHGLIFSASMTMYSVWIPKDEMSTAIAIQNACANLGATVVLPLVGWMCDEFGWRLSFYVFGAIGSAWFVMWTLCVTDDPADHKWISGAEMDTIKSTCQVRVTTTKPSVPWLAVVTSLRVWASCIAKITASFTYYFVGTMLPSYLAHVLGFELKTNGLFNAIIYLLVAVSCVIAGVSADFLRRKNVIPLTLIRKINQSISMLIPALFLAIVPSVGLNPTAILCLIFTAMFFYGFQSGGEMPIVADFAPEISGTIFGVSNTVSSIGSFLSPMVIGMLVNENITSRETWDKVFYTCAILLVIGSTFFNVFADATVDPKMSGSSAKSSKKVTANGAEQGKERF